MDGAFYVDTKPPFQSGDLPTVTMATTAKALIPPAYLPLFPSNYFNAFVGKAVRVKIFGTMTTGATPGNLSWQLNWTPTGADASGVGIVASTTYPLALNGTNLSWAMEFTVRSRTLGPAGTLKAAGVAWFNNGLIASTNQPILFPVSNPGSLAAVDLTAANYLSMNFSRSGSTGEFILANDVIFEALN